MGEKPLLLNPCLDHPENYLEFILEGAGGGLVRPKLRPDGRISRRAEVSIEVYALQRKTLVDRRQGRLILVRKQIGRVNKLIQRLNDDPDDPTIAADLEEEMKELGRMRKDDQQFLAMTRQCISEMLSV